MKTQTLITIPENIAKMGELVILPRKEFEILVRKGKEQELLHLSREAKNLKKGGRLPILNSLRDFR